MVIENSNLLKVEPQDIKDGILVIPQGIDYIDTFILPLEQEDSFFSTESCRRKLETLWLPSSLKYLGKQCFIGCKKLKNVLFYDSQKDIDDYNMGKRDIDYYSTYNNIEKIDNGAFARTNIKKFVVTKTIKNLGDRCFGSTSLENLEFAPDVTISTFKTSVLDRCDKIMNLELPKSIKDFVIVNGEGCKNLKTIKFNSFPSVRKENKEFIFYTTTNMNPTIECEGLKDFGEIRLKYLLKVDKEFGLIAVTKQDGETVITLIKDDDKIFKYSIDENQFNFNCEMLEISIARGYILKFYEFEKIKKELNILRKVPADIVSAFETEKDIRDYLTFSSKNKIYRKTENECLVFSKVNNSTQNYMKGLVTLSFLLGAFSESESLRQKASDFIYSNVLKEDNSFKTHKLLIFSYAKIYNNNDEEYYKFWRKNFKELDTLNITNATWDRVTACKFYDYLNQNFDRLNKLCYASKTELTVLNAVNVYNNEINLCYEEDKKDISEELKKYPRTSKDDVEFIYNIKKEMEKNEIGQNMFEPVNKDEIKLLYDESKLLDKLSGETFEGYKFVFLNKYRTKNMTYAIDDRTGCANIFNIGMGIVAGGMKLDNCQNLRIFDDKGKGIARATIILNREQGTILYNTFLVYGHTSMTEDELLKIYRAFKLATISFIYEYEKNFPNNTKINQVNVGMGYNGLEKILEKYYVRPHDNFKGVNFSLYGSREVEYMYNGDWESGQYMLYNKRELELIRREKVLLEQESQNNLV